jgi:hypothetical protein
MFMVQDIEGFEASPLIFTHLSLGIFCLCFRELIFRKIEI